MLNIQTELLEKQVARLTVTLEPQQVEKAPRTSTSRKGAPDRCSQDLQSGEHSWFSEGQGAISHFV